VRNEDQMKRVASRPKGKIVGCHWPPTGHQGAQKLTLSMVVEAGRFMKALLRVIPLVWRYQCQSQAAAAKNRCVPFVEEMECPNRLRASPAVAFHLSHPGHSVPKSTIHSRS
jgi:hypothetical protein